MAAAPSASSISQRFYVRLMRIRRTSSPSRNTFVCMLPDMTWEDARNDKYLCALAGFALASVSGQILDVTRHAEAYGQLPRDNRVGFWIKAAPRSLPTSKRWVYTIRRPCWTWILLSDIVFIL
jgi:hypothetical protein